MTPKLQEVRAVCEAFDCASCVYLSEGRCRGCIAENQELMAGGGRVCAIYECASGRGIASCSRCDSGACPQGRLDHLCVIMARHSSDRSWRDALAEHLARHGAEVVAAPDVRLGDRAIARMRLYLAAIDDLTARGEHVISSWDIAEQVGVKPGLVRKDLSYLGRQLGTPSVGYDAETLKRRVLHTMGMTGEQCCVWVGAGRVIAHPDILDECARQGLQCVAVFDEDPQMAGRPVAAGLEVRPLEDLSKVMLSREITCAVVACDVRDPQGAADRLVKSGVRAILNLSPKAVKTPEGVALHQGDLATQLFVLAYAARH